ncbi:hypothetical protein Pfo_020255 [Paulownia fortunei]|nr:hypothetical protein Pfo_020255 [Paulownia fortunei]
MLHREEREEMALFSIQNPMVFTFGILGNLVSFLVYLAPAPTFYRILKKKSTEEFQSVPYVVALLSSMLWIYYATLKSNETLLITINSVGCFIEAIYISIFISYAPKKARMLALKLLLLLNFVGFGLILIFTHFLVKESQRVQVLGWISVTLSASVYIAPLSIMKQVIRTKSVEFMPISLSFALLLNAVMWFFYGLLLKDFYIAVPNIVGFIFGALQIILYLVYKNCKPDTEDKLPTNAKPKAITTTEIHPVGSLPLQDDQNLEIITVAEGHGGAQRQNGDEPN